MLKAKRFPVVRDFTMSWDGNRLFFGANCLDVFQVRLEDSFRLGNVGGWDTLAEYDLASFIPKCRVSGAGVERVLHELLVFVLEFLLDRRLSEEAGNQRDYGEDCEGMPERVHGSKTMA
jgi:hypothetical protein